MNSTTLIVAIAALVVVGAILFLVQRRRRSTNLRSTFGPEYDRTVQDVGDRHKAEAELAERQRRVSRLEIRELSPSERDRFIGAWRSIQAEFVDQPRQALIKADDLLTDLMRARGYPTDDFEQRSADLSVDHPSVVQNYRSGRNIAARDTRGEANTEDLRQAMIHFRALFDELVSDRASDAQRRVS